MSLGTVTVFFDARLFIEHARMLSVGLTEQARRFHRAKPTAKDIAREALKVPGVMKVSR